MTFLNWCAQHWFLAFIFLMVAGSLLEGVRDFFLGIVRELSGNKHKRKIKELKLRVQIAEAQAGGKPAVKPGPCVHRNVRPVVGTDDEVKAWLCKTCDTQLPADWAVREEDL